jgi:hypothetical protein
MSSDQQSSAGQKAAFGRRKVRQAKIRHWIYQALRVAGVRYTRAFPDFLEFFPPVRDSREFTELSTRVACYLGDAELPLYLPGPRFPLASETTPFFEPSLVRDPGWLSERPSGVGHLVIHRLNAVSLRRIATSTIPVTVTDPRLAQLSEDQYFVLRNSASWPTYAPAEIALERLQTISGDAESAFILLTGPSALEVDLGRVVADIRITCNSTVRDLDLIREYRPNIIAFSDPYFHFGPSRYAAAFRRDVLRAVEEVNSVVLCTDRYAAPLLSLAPQLADRLAVIPIQPGGPWRWPTRRNPTVRTGSSVLTTLLLPVAMMLTNDISIAGADGRQPTENYFWKHNPRIQYSPELMQTVFDAHPAFFRDRDYEDYYDGFCADIEALAQIGETAGKTVRAVTPSWIPALRKRGAAEPCTSGNVCKQKT